MLGRVRGVVLGMILLTETQGFLAPWSPRVSWLAGQGSSAGRCALIPVSTAWGRAGISLDAAARAIGGLQMGANAPSGLETPAASQHALDRGAEGEHQERAQRRRSKPRGNYRTRGVSKGEVDAAVLDRAFAAFADTMLLKKGRVRFHRINEAFRREFPDWASEDKLSNQTLGRRVQIWYENKYGERLGKSGRGAYIGLTMLNPQYVSLDMRRIREVQAEINPDRAKMMESMGIRINQGVKAGNVGDPVSAASPRARARKVKEGAPVGRPGGAARVSQRLGSMKPEELSRRSRLGSMGGTSASGEKILRRSKKYAGADTKAQAMEPALTLCVEAFANTMLVDTGESTFRDIYDAFKAQFPLLADQKHLAPNFLGAHLRDWYQAKYKKELVRAKIVKGDGKTKMVTYKNKRRSSLPFQGLSLVADVTAADMSLMNEAKVALRRALKMEGVGIMVRRNKAGQFVVATMMPGSPASIGGNVQPDDVILAVGGVETDGMSPQQLADAVLGPRGSRVTFTLRRAGDIGADVDVESGQAVLPDRVYCVELVREEERRIIYALHTYMLCIHTCFTCTHTSMYANRHAHIYA